MEMAFGQYHIEKKRFVSLESAFLKWNKEYLVQTSASEITGLTRNFCEQYGEEARYILAKFARNVQQSKMVCGHNAVAFDLPLTLANMSRALPGMDARKILEEAICVDTLLDCPFPKSMKQHSLKYLALDHSYVLTGAHQAVSDVMACAHILSCYDWELVKKIAATPVITITKKIDFQEIEKRDELKSLRFFWNPTRKVWEKRIREYYLQEVQSQLSFKLDQI
jgi:DNA polymerase III alpha subunit (gram-positive type)